MCSMTIDEKKQYLYDWCRGHPCDECMFNNEFSWCVRSIGSLTETELNYILDKVGLETVDHPDHYNREDAIEAIDEMVMVFGKEAVKNFCLCNVWKYRYRASDKNGNEDILKSDWYMRKYEELSKE